MIKVKFQGLKVLINRFERAQNRAKDITTMVMQEAEALSSTSKSLAPVKTGKLRNSHYFKKQEGKNKVTATIGFKAFYAPYQDFGTGRKFNLTSTLSPYQNYIAGFKGANQNHKGLRARKFLFHHYVITTRRITRKARTRFKNIMKT